MLEKIDKIQELLNVPNVDTDPKTALVNMKILNLLVDLRAEAKQLILSGVVVPKGTLCYCGGTERVALDCTMKPCKHPKYFKE